MNVAFGVNAKVRTKCKSKHQQPYRLPSAASPLFVVSGEEEEEEEEEKVDKVCERSDETSEPALMHQTEIILNPLPFPARYHN